MRYHLDTSDQILLEEPESCKVSSLIRNAYHLSPKCHTRDERKDKLLGFLYCPWILLQGNHWSASSLKTCNKAVLEALELVDHVVGSDPTWALKPWRFL